MEATILRNLEQGRVVARLLAGDDARMDVVAELGRLSRLSAHAADASALRALTASRLSSAAVAKMTTLSPDAYRGSVRKLLRDVRRTFAGQHPDLVRRANDLAMHTNLGAPFVALVLAGRRGQVLERLRELAGEGDEAASEALELLASLVALITFWVVDLVSLMPETTHVAPHAALPSDDAGPPGELVRRSPAVLRGPSFIATSGVPFPGASVVARAA